MSFPDDDPEYVDDDVEYEDDPLEEEYFEEEEPAKVEPLTFPDAYAAALIRPVELEVRGHSDAFKVLADVKESRFPAKKVSKSATSLAKALRAIALKGVVAK